ncbi:MAG: PAS domain S-box protein [Myxococcota bacterium]
MSLRFRLGLIISLSIVVFSLVMAKIVVDEARHAIHEEMEAGTKITRQLLSSVLSSGSFLVQNEDPSDAMRSFLHGLGRVRSTEIRLIRDDGTLSYASPPPLPERDGRRAVPAWFVTLVTPELPVAEFDVPGGRVVLAPDPANALFDEWTDLKKLIRLAVGFLVLVNVAAFWLLGRALRPIGKILSGLSEMEHGRLDTRLPRFHLPEFDSIGRTFNRMAEALEDGHVENARLARVAMQSSDAILIHDLDGTVTFWNPAAERLFGYRAEEIVGRSAELLDPPADEPGEAGSAPGTGDKCNVDNLETRRRARDGRIVDIALSTAALVDPASGEVLGGIQGMRDITERKRAEATQRELTENRHFTQRMQTRLEEERRTIARELHDELGQFVTAIKTIGTAIANRTADSDPEVHRNAGTIVQIATRIYDGVHGIIRQLRPSTLDHLGLPAAVEDLVKEWSRRNPETTCALEMEGEVGGLGEAVNIAIYRLIQECLTNVTRHSGATRVDVAIRRDALGLEVEVSDDGKGLADRDEGGRLRLGVVGMRERVQALGGRFQLGPGPGSGFRVAASIPIPAVPPTGIDSGARGVEGGG